MISSLKHAIYSHGDSEGLWHTLKRLVVDTFLCLLAEKCWTIFQAKSEYPRTHALDKLIYQRSAMPWKVPAISLHFKESEAPTIAVWLLTMMMCSSGSLLPSKEGKGGDLKLSSTVSSHTTSDRGWRSKGSSGEFFLSCRLGL